MALWLPEFLRKPQVSRPALWGKVPSRGDFIRHNVKHAQSEALQAWIGAHLQATRAVNETPVPQAKPISTKRRRTEDTKWNHLTPVELVEPWQAVQKASVPAVPVAQKAMVRPSAGHAGLPWCFVLPPGSFPFAAKEHVIGVWITSSDKIGRVYPLIMMQTASAQWIQQYFQHHAQQPCDWLFAAARAMACTVYVEEMGLDRSAHRQSQQEQPDRLFTLVTQLEQLWALYQVGRQSDRRGLFGGIQKIRKDANVQTYIAAPHSEDPAHRLHGVRYLPWADWPHRLTGKGMDSTQHAAFWQQDLTGRFVGVAERMQDVV